MRFIFLSIYGFILMALAIILWMNSGFFVDYILPKGREATLPFVFLAIFSFFFVEIFSYTIFKKLTDESVRAAIYLLSVPIAVVGIGITVFAVIAGYRLYEFLVRLL